MMQQYWEVRNTLPANTLLLFRLGDFFEMFFEDAEEGSRLLGITLTKRQDYPMAGIPYHALDAYVGKLLAAGRKVAICDQAEPATTGKLVKRALTRILSPGTTLEPAQLEAKHNRFLCALHRDSRGLHASWLDLTSGEFRLATDTGAENLLPVLHAIAPSEVIVAEGAVAKWKLAPHADTATHALAAFCEARLVNELPAFHFEAAEGARTVMEVLGVLNLQGFGIGPEHHALGAAGALVHYATESLCATPGNLHKIEEYRSGAAVLLDPATLRNLEIFRSVSGTRQGSLLAAIDRTVTPPGARLLERFLAEPLLELTEIHRRQRAVEALAGRSTLLAELREALGKVRDIHRILGRLQNRLRNPRELGGVRETLEQCPAIADQLERSGSPDLAAFCRNVHALPELRALLARGLRDELPGQIDDGGIIRDGYDADLDRMLALTRGNREWISDLERQEQERTGIKSLKVRFTNAFGYFIEVTKSNLHLVPADYIRRQTTVGGERFVTEGLRAKEKEIFHAEENALAREQELFNGLVEAVVAESPKLATTASALAELDVFAGWATLAREQVYVRPLVDDTDTLEIKEGRHPVVEQFLRDSRGGLAGSQTFVPNNTEASASEAQILLITGPNMAGKSTYIRQVALIALLAHIGCYVPARSCRIGLVDRIFSRVGASDDLARGNSTFMVEMNETANILNHASARSLIILDEIGRGTSTYDGLSIAWAVVEHLHADPARGPRTLFATHYQELTQLEKHLPRLRNLSVAVKEWNEEIVFVRRVVPGAADRSYGIQVARLAGIPQPVIDRAKTILAQLESDDATVTLPAPTSRPKRKIRVEPEGDGQLTLL
jgi:DNA mismatch repair protein MutS